MSLLITDIVAAWRDKIYNSTAIADFCTNNYNKALSLQVGSDDKKMLGEKDCPFINIIPMRSTPGITQQEVSWDIDIDLGLLDDVFEDFQGIDVKEMRGIYRLDAFVKLVIDEFTEMACVNNIIADSIDFNMDSSTFFPMHIGSLSIQSRLTLPIGANVSFN